MSSAIKLAIQLRQQCFFINYLILWYSKYSRSWWIIVYNEHTPNNVIQCLHVTWQRHILLHSENARVFAKWQWIARDCITRLHDRVRFTVISHTPVRSRYYHIHIVYKLNLDGSCLMNIAQKLLVEYFSNLPHCVAESWRNMPFKGTRHGNGAVAKSCYDCDSTHQHYDV